MSLLLYKCMTKAVLSDTDQLQYGPNWLYSRRAVLKIFEDHLECRDWTIHYEEIQEAILYSIRSFFIPGYVLRIQTRDKTFWFGLNWGKFWSNNPPFPMKRERKRMRYSWFSLMIRLVALSCLLLILLQWLWGKWNDG
jgi:hypothetical protein